MKKQLGFSLSEILIGLFLSSLIVSLLMQLYLSSKRQYSAADAILSASLDLHWVNDLMADAIRRAGFTPCVGIDQLRLEDRREHSKAVRAIQIENYPQQFIQTNRMDEHFSEVIHILNPTQIRVSSPTSFHAKLPLLIADCKHAEIHQAFSIERNKESTLITFARPLKFNYNATSYIGEFLEERWFIKKRKGQGEPALYYHLLHTEEITPLIQSLKIQSQKIQNKQFIKVIMGLVGDKVRTFHVLVRGS